MDSGLKVGLIGILLCLGLSIVAEITQETNFGYFVFGLGAFAVFTTFMSILNLRNHKIPVQN